jgi:alpha-glucosidase/alpha-D-xyloside xylohydrolase
MLIVLSVGLAMASPTTATEGQRARVEVRAVGGGAVRITHVPAGATLPHNPALIDADADGPVVRFEQLDEPGSATLGALTVGVTPAPLTVRVTDAAGRLIQELRFESDGTVTFPLDGQPVLGLGEGGPRAPRDSNWRQDPVQFDRRGRLDPMEPRWQADMYGSRNPAPVLLGTGGWALFVAAPWVEVDLRDEARGVLRPVAPDSPAAPQTEENQQAALGKGLPPPDAFVSGLFDVFVLDAREPQAAMRDLAEITGAAAMPPRWALGYMQSHRTLEDDTQLLEIVDTFRRKQIPLDAVIYLGTGFAPRGWNKEQPSFEFNPEVFTRDPAAVIADMHDRDVKVLVHMVPWDRDRLPTLHGSIPAKAGEPLDAGHIQNYWQEHQPLLDAGIDGFWPDEGDWFNLHERLRRHQMYYEGSLLSRPDVRPWHLQRNGYPGIARWGGWVWSGDTDSSWKTLEAQIAVGLNYSLSLGPFWGSDIGGFYPNSELTGELYVRWVQFAAFCASFRAHGRVWWTRLPWGWGLDDVGPREYGNANAPIPADDPRNILATELGNPAIEPIAKRYIELRYELMPYTYTLAREAHDTGMPLMRAMWLHYPDDVRARGLGTQYLWGKDLLIAPVFERGATGRSVYLPHGLWYDWWTNEALTGGGDVSRTVDLETLPIYARAGAIIPVDPVRQHTGEAVTEPTTLRIYTGADGDFTLYEDDGLSQQYLEGQGTWTRITWDDAARRLVVAPRDAATGISAPRSFRLLLLPEGIEQTVVYDGSSTQLHIPRH